MKSIQAYIILFIILGFFSCIEEFDPKTEDEFTSLLVVEATITNQLINQKVLVSRAYKLEDEGPFPEINAEVSVIGSDNISYLFEEFEPGIYQSVDVFAAQPNVDYRLNIMTTNGLSYTSELMRLTSEVGIDDVYFERGPNENDEDGVLVKVDSYDPTGNSRYYRYTFEQTFKIIAPFYSPLELVFDGETPPLGFGLIPKEEQQQICYRTELSNTIIIENTNLLGEDRISGFPAHFLGSNNYKISHRYSILLTQYIQSLQGHEYYKSLKELSESESILSETQPGFINGNVFSTSNENERVIGFFEVSAADSRRIYFNYADLYPGENLPPYIISCNPFAPLEFSMGGGSPLLNALERGNVYFEPNGDQIEGEGAFDLVQPACGNCTVLGSNMPPDFWVE